MKHLLIFILLSTFTLKSVFALTYSIEIVDKSINGKQAENLFKELTNGRKEVVTPGTIIYGEDVECMSYRGKPSNWNAKYSYECTIRMNKKIEIDSYGKINFVN